MENIFNALRSIALKYKDAAIIYPVHLNPNVQGPAKRILSGVRNITLLSPVNYIDMANVLKASYMVVTDSGGIQEEAPSLGKPVLVLRNVTERPEAVVSGTVKIVGTGQKKVYGEIARLLDDAAEYARMSRSVNPYGDGKASLRTVEAIRYFFGLRKNRPDGFTPLK
jgi:UDP-N-acetylglucosamine 2-epimerase (non-hydrolysing)